MSPVNDMTPYTMLCEAGRHDIAMSPVNDRMAYTMLHIYEAGICIAMSPVKDLVSYIML